MLFFPLSFSTSYVAFFFLRLCDALDEPCTALNEVVALCELRAAGGGVAGLDGGKGLSIGST